MYYNGSFNDIYKSYYHPAFLYVKSYIHDDMAAEDIVSESLIKLWEEMKKGHIDPVKPFLFTILRNSSLDYLKHLSIQKNVHSTLEKGLSRELEIRISSLESCDPNTIFSDEVQQIIKSTLDSLPGKTREIFLLSRFENKSHKEITEIYGITTKGVEYHISQAIKALRSSLKDYLPLIGFLPFLNY